MSSAQVSLAKKQHSWRMEISTTFNGSSPADLTWCHLNSSKKFTWTKILLESKINEGPRTSSYYFQKTFVYNHGSHCSGEALSETTAKTNIISQIPRPVCSMFGNVHLWISWVWAKGRHSIHGALKKKHTSFNPWPGSSFSNVHGGIIPDGWTSIWIPCRIHLERCSRT